MPKKTADQELEENIKTIMKAEDELALLESELAQNEQFAAFIQMQQAVNKTRDELFKLIEAKMIDNDIKTVKGDWGSITLAERTTWTGDVDVLPRKFVKKTADAQKIATSFKLEGEAPKGATSKTTQYLVKKFKK